MRKKARMMRWESVDQIPSPFIHSHNVWKTSCMALAIRTPYAIYPNTNKGALDPPVS
jgi:hypothetical protein